MSIVCAIIGTTCKIAAFACWQHRRQHSRLRILSTSSVKPSVAGPCAACQDSVWKLPEATREAGLRQIALGEPCIAAVYGVSPVGLGDIETASNGDLSSLSGCP